MDIQNAIIAFDALSQEDRDAIMAAAKVAEERGWKESEALNGGYKKTMAEKGMTVGPATDAMKKDLAGIGDTMSKEWAEKAGPDGQAILDAYRK